MQADEPVDGTDGRRNGFAEIGPRVRIEQALLVSLAALHPDIDRQVAVSPAPHLRDPVVRVRALGGRAEFVLAEARAGRVVRADLRPVRERPHQLAAEHDRASGETRDDDVESDADAGPEVNLEHSLADPQALWLPENAFTNRHARGRIA